jgi:hypothetical protein
VTTADKSLNVGTLASVAARGALPQAADARAVSALPLGISSDSDSLTGDKSLEKNRLR